MANLVLVRNKEMQRNNRERGRKVMTFSNAKGNRPAMFLCPNDVSHQGEMPSSTPPQKKIDASLSLSLAVQRGRTVRQDGTPRVLSGEQQ